MKKYISIGILIVLILSSSINYSEVVNPDESVLKWPTTSKNVTNQFGAPREHGYHKGIDISPLRNGISGDPIYSVGNGKVVYIGTPRYGRTVAINHDIRGTGLGVDYVQSVYTHLTDSVTVDLYDYVKRSQFIACMGGSGNPNINGPFIENGYPVHLHYETRKITNYEKGYVWEEDLPINPLHFYRGGGIVINSTPLDEMLKISPSNNVDMLPEDDDYYSYQHGVIKENQLYTIDYILGMSFEEVNNADISVTELSELAEKIKNSNYESYLILKELINMF